MLLSGNSSSEALLQTGTYQVRCLLLKLIRRDTLGGSFTEDTLSCDNLPENALSDENSPE